MSEFNKTVSKSIKIADNSNIISNGSGYITVNFDQHERNNIKTVTDVMYVSELSTNLLSVNQMTKKGYVVIFDNKGFDNKLKFIMKIIFQQKERLNLLEARKMVCILLTNI